MENIILLSVHATYGLALVLFLGMAGWRLYAAGAKGTGGPPELPVGKVAVWFYRPLDLLGIALLGGVFYLLSVGNALASEDKNPPPMDVARVAVTIMFLFFMAGMAVAIVSRRMGPVQWLGLRWREWPWVLLIAPGTVVGMWVIFAGLQGLGYMELMEKLGVAKMQETVELFQEGNDTGVLVMMGFAAVIVAPLCEEVIFRGYLYPAAKRFAGPWVAAVCTALIFSAAHGNMAALLPLFVFGLVLVALYEFTGSIWAPVAAHFLFNAATVAIQMLVRIYDLPVPT